jgi:hypothetical protein
MRSVVAGLVFVVGCSGSAKPVGPKVLRPAACTPEVKSDRDAGKATLSVGGVEVAAIEPEHPEGVKAVVYPYGWRSVLVTWTAPGHYGGFDGGSELWEVDCDAPKEKKTFLAIEGANFGASAMTRDGKTLYFSGPTYVRALDVATKQVRVVSRPGKVASCWMGDEFQLADTITRFDEDEDVLELSRGGPCGFEGDYEGSLVYLDHPSDPKGERPASPVLAIAVDASGAWWASAAGALWQSTDAGATWRKLPLVADGAGPASIHLDPKRPGHLVVVTAATGEHGFDTGGFAHASRDGGATWSRLALPPDLDIGWTDPDKTEGEHHPLGLVLQVRTSTDDLVLWGPEKTGADGDGERPPVAWETADGGKSWKRIASPSAPPDVPQQATAKGVTLKTSSDGLLVIAPGATRPKRIYPK